MKPMKKTYKINHIKVLAGFIISALLLAGAMVLFLHYLEADVIFIISVVASLFVCVIGLIGVLFRCISKIEFDGNNLKIT